MKSQVVYKDKGESYPALYESNHPDTTGLIVLFHRAEQGVVVAQGKSFHSVGLYSELWEMHTFKQITNPITIHFN